MFNLRPLAVSWYQTPLLLPHLFQYQRDNSPKYQRTFHIPIGTALAGRVSGSRHNCCWVMSLASRTIKDGSITLPKSESCDTSRHSLKIDRQNHPIIFEVQFEERPGRIIPRIIVTPISRFPGSGGTAYTVSLLKYLPHSFRDSRSSIV